MTGETVGRNAANRDGIFMDFLKSPDKCQEISGLGVSRFLTNPSHFIAHNSHHSTLCSSGKW